MNKSSPLLSNAFEMYIWSRRSLQSSMLILLLERSPVPRKFDGKELDLDSGVKPVNLGGPVALEKSHVTNGNHAAK